MKEMQEPAFVVIPLQTLEDLLHEVQGLKDQINALENRQIEDNSNLHREIALDRQRISRLEHKEPQPLQKDRADILRALLVANNGKMLSKDARKKMHLSKSRFSELVATMKDEIDSKPYHLNKNWRVLSLK